MLKMTGVKTELILDTDMEQFIEKGMGGGFSYIAQRYSKANNQSMKSYGRVQLSEIKIAEDHNHMHRWAILKSVPTSKFELIEAELKFLESFDLNDFSEYSPKWSILDVLFLISEELHDLHNEYKERIVFWLLKED